MAKELNFAEIKNFYSPLGQFPIKIETGNRVLRILRACDLYVNNVLYGN